MFTSSSVTLSATEQTSQSPSILITSTHDDFLLYLSSKWKIVHSFFKTLYGNLFCLFQLFYPLISAIAWLWLDWSKHLVIVREWLWFWWNIEKVKTSILIVVPILSLTKVLGWPKSKVRPSFWYESPASWYTSHPPNRFRSDWITPTVGWKPCNSKFYLTLGLWQWPSTSREWALCRISVEPPLLQKKQHTFFSCPLRPLAPGAPWHLDCLHCKSGHYLSSSTSVQYKNTI